MKFSYITMGLNIVTTKHGIACLLKKKMEKTNGKNTCDPKKKLSAHPANCYNHSSLSGPLTSGGRATN